MMRAEIGCQLVDNWAHADGAGVRVKEADATVRNCLIARNRSFGYGGGLNVKGATGRLSVENCTVADNRTRLAGGGVAATEGGTATNANTILWGNAPDQVSSGVASHHSCVEGGASGTGNLTNAPSMTTVLCRLPAGSSCIDFGTNAAWMTTATDIEDDARIAGTVVDIGADEFVDSDSDGLSDAWELRYFGDLDGADGTADGDGDGLTDAEESAWDTDPADADTDGDGASDGAEVAAATSPTTPATPDTLTLAVSVGDLSDKPAEKYKIVFSNSAEVMEYTGLDFGGLWSTNLTFQKGTSYTIRVEHAGTSPVTNSSDCWPEPGYDYIAEIASKPNSTNGTHDAWIYGDAFIIHDPDKILGTHDGEDCTPDFAATNGSGIATLYILKAELDIDSDNDEDFGEPDRDPDAEDAIEEDTDKPGKYVIVNNRDADSDGVPDYADGFNWDASLAADNSNVSDDFAQLVVELPEPIDLSVAWLRITHSDSDPDPANPAGITRTGAGTTGDPYVYTPPTDGHLRLWKKDANQARNWHSVNDSTLAISCHPQIMTTSPSWGLAAQGVFAQ